MSKVITVYADLDNGCPGIGHLRTSVTDAMTGDVLHTIDLERGTVYAGLIMGITWAWLSTDADVIYTNNTGVYYAFMGGYGHTSFTYHDDLDLNTKRNLAWCENKVNELGCPPSLRLWQKKEMNNTDIRAARDFFCKLPQEFVEGFDLYPCGFEKYQQNNQEQRQ